MTWNLRDSKTGRLKKGELDVVQRFWAKVRKSDGCWEWTGFRNQCGYGGFGLSWDGVKQYTRTIVAHRFAWMLVHGPIPKGMLICHRCDNPACVRIDHLFMGTQKDNMRDAAIKNRTSAGEHRPNSKLTANQVREIRRRHAAGENCNALSREFGISGVNAYKICNGEKWRRV